MKYIKKFNENKNIDIPEEIWNKIDNLHNRLIYIAKKFVESKLSKIKNISDDDDTVIRTHCDFKIEIPNNDEFSEYIIDYIIKNKEAYFVEYEHPFLIFTHNESKYKVPLNLYAGYNADYEDRRVSYMKYSVWINKYVIQKI